MDNKKAPRFSTQCFQKNYDKKYNLGDIKTQNHRASQRGEKCNQFKRIPYAKVTKRGSSVRCRWRNPEWAFRSAGKSEVRPCIPKARVMSILKTGKVYKKVYSKKIPNEEEDRGCGLSSRQDIAHPSYRQSCIKLSVIARSQLFVDLTFPCRLKIDSYSATFRRKQFAITTGILAPLRAAFTAR